jgi:tetrahydromethanopterin S-methyltransferase subunit G
MFNSQDVEIIRNIVIEVIDPRLSDLESRLEKKIDSKLDEKIGELALITKHGFDEVYTRLDNIEHRLERVEGIVMPTGYSVATA